MDSSVLLSLVGVALVLSIIVLAGLCLNCKGNNKSNTETHFNTLPSHSSIPVISPTIDPRRPSPCPSIDCDSQIDDYVNQEDEFVRADSMHDFQPDKNQECPDYLDVLPDMSPDDPHQSHTSIASSANSGLNYENVVNTHSSDQDDDGDEVYINVAPDKPGPNYHIDVVIGSYESDGQDSMDYVNAESIVAINHM